MAGGNARDAIRSGSLAAAKRMIRRLLCPRWAIYPNKGSRVYISAEWSAREMGEEREMARNSRSPPSHSRVIRGAFPRERASDGTLSKMEVSSSVFARRESDPWKNRRQIESPLAPLFPSLSQSAGAFLRFTRCACATPLFSPRLHLPRPFSSTIVRVVRLLRLSLSLALSLFVRGERLFIRQDISSNSTKCSILFLYFYKALLAEFCWKIFSTYGKKVRDEIF